MDPTDVKAVTIPTGAGVTEFSTTGDIQVIPAGTGGRIKGFWVTPCVTITTGFGSTFIDIYDGESVVLANRILRIGITGGRHVEQQAGIGYTIPGNGIRFSNGLFLDNVAIETGGTFQSITIFYQI